MLAFIWLVIYIFFFSFSWFWGFFAFVFLGFFLFFFFYFYYFPSMKKHHFIFKCLGKERAQSAMISTSSSKQILLPHCNHQMEFYRSLVGTPTQYSNFFFSLVKAWTKINFQALLKTAPLFTGDKILSHVKESKQTKIHHH